MSYRLAIGWALFAFLGFNGLLLLSAWLRPSSLRDLVHLGLCEALVLLGTAALVLWVHAGNFTLSHALGLRPTTPALVGVGFLVGLSLRVPADSLRQWGEALWPTPDTVLLAQAELLQFETVTDKIVLLSVLVVVGPLVEELFYRGALFGPLVRARGVGGAVLATGCLFVLAHGQWRDFVALAPVALALGYVRAVSGSLLPALALHMAFNLSAVWVLVLGMASATEPLSLPLGLSLTGFGVVFALLIVVQRVAFASPLAAAARRDDLLG